MVDFNTFVKSLGPHAEDYTLEQLRQLHVDVQKLVRVLLAIHDARKTTAGRRPYPQSRVDRAGDDRTLKDTT